MKLSYILPVFVLFLLTVCESFSQEIPQASQYRLVVKKKNDPGKTRTLILDKSVQITVYERYDKNALDYVDDLLFGYDPGYIEYKGPCTIINDSVLMVDGDSININSIRTIKAHVDKTAGETVMGAIMLGSVPLWGILAYQAFTWSGLGQVLGVLFISVPAATAGLACAGLGIYYLASRTINHNYKLYSKWDLQIKKHSIPVNLSPE